LTLQESDVIAAAVENSDLTVQNADLKHKLKLAEKECSNLKLSVNELHEISDNANREFKQDLGYRFLSGRHDFA